MTTSTPMSSQECTVDSSTAVRLAYDSDEDSFENAPNDMKHEAVAVMSSLAISICSSHEASSANSIFSTTTTPIR